jgi:hypothetical protein
MTGLVHYYYRKKERKEIYTRIKMGARISIFVSCITNEKETCRNVRPRLLGKAR